MMSLRLYFVFIAVTVWTFGANFQKVNAFGNKTGKSFAELFLQELHPEDFLSNTGNTQTCPYTPTITCQASNTFRTIDGSCNKPSSPYRGKSNTPYLRMWTNMYFDFLRIPRITSFLGGDLPTPREISLKFFTDSADESIKKNNLFTIFARFVEHDLYYTKLLDGTNCCQKNNPTSVTCNNINLKADDPYFQAYKRTCLPKAKAVSSPTINCQQGVFQQINQNTHYIDLSNIYGPIDLAANNLRTKTDGLLKESDKNNLLPKLDTTACQLPNPNPENMHCFLAGDLRANNDPLLMTFYTIWVRHHNSVAKELKAILKNANDENIYQTARKIVIAEYQHIVYNEFLPALYSKTSLKPLPTGYTTKSDKVNPDILNIFSIAYTGLVDTLVRKDFTFSSTTEKLEKYWYNPSKLWETGGIKSLVTGMLTDAAGKIDRHIVKPLTDQYLAIVAGQGTDKIAVDIQQTRENGITNYYLLYSITQKKFELASYNDLADLDTTTVAELKKLYPNVFDLEFLPGLLAEKPMASEEIGPMLKELIETQFKNLKEGDDLYYEHKDIFTADRLTEIKKITMAKILCDHAEQVDVQKETFAKVDATSNPASPCTGFQTPNLCLWATANWSDWIKSKCIGGIVVSTRQCEILPGSKCECPGRPFKFEGCPNNIVSSFTLEKVDSLFSKDYYKFFDHKGYQIHNNGEDSSDVIQNILTLATSA